ncbi:LysR family transcriptional regulator [Ideonella sp.]|uniref:LysR family transcriptional regulator n=1 Tax=Ideonella sp. TaxID=1929293 RepID=UPI0035B2F6E7
METRSEPDWQWYRSFLAVLDQGSLSAAARALGLTQPTLGRHIDALEAALQLKLFTRSFDGFAPTDAAQALRPYAVGLADTAAALLRTASGQREGVRGTVRITASEVVGVEVLPPILAALRRDHPELVIELVLSNQMDDLLRREADIAVRMVPPTQGALIARRIGAIELGMHARADYLARCGTPQRVDELAGHSLVGFDKETARLRRMQSTIGSFDRSIFALRADSDLAQLAMIRAGFGLGICQVGLARRDGLVRVLPHPFSFPLDTWVAMHEDLRDSLRCAVSFAALVEGLSAYITTAAAAPAKKPKRR